jgi:hypothetical protein
VITFGSIGDGMLPVSCQEQVIIELYICAMESPIKKKINIKQERYLQWWDVECGFKQKKNSRSAYLQGH